LRSVRAYIDFDIMIARHTLIAPASKIIEILLVKTADRVCHVVAVVIDCVRDLVRRLDGGDCEPRRWNNKPFIDENICSRRMSTVISDR